MYLRYSFKVVAPMQRSSPRAIIGFNRLPASIAPSVAPAPTTVCTSSINNKICPSDFTTSLRTDFNLSSNSPRYLAPATKAPISKENKVLFFRDSGTSPATTPGSPINTGLFLVRRDKISMVLLISSSRPITGSSLPWRATWVKSRPYFSRAL